jgi:hypothetical protein
MHPVVLLDRRPPGLGELPVPPEGVLERHILAARAGCLPSQVQQHYGTLGLTEAGTDR